MYPCVVAAEKGTQFSNETGNESKEEQEDGDGGRGGGCSAASSRPLLPAILRHPGSSPPPAAPAAGVGRLMHTVSAHLLFPAAYCVFTP